MIKFAGYLHYTHEVVSTGAWVNWDGLFYSLHYLFKVSTGAFMRANAAGGIWAVEILVCNTSLRVIRELKELYD